MLKMNLQIGTKLGISAGIGVVLVAAMVANQMIVNRAASHYAEQLKAAETAEKAIITAERELRRIIIMQRDIVRAQNPKELERPIERVAAFQAEGKKAFETAERAATRAEDRQQIGKTKEMFARFATVVLESVGTQKEILDFRNRQAQQGVEWGKKFDALMASPVVTGAANQAELVRALEQANLMFKQARLLFWSYLARSANDMPPRINAAIDASAKLVGEARKLAKEPAAAKAVDEFVPMVSEYKDVVGKILTAMSRQTKYLTETLDPVRIEMDKILEQVKANLAKHQIAVEGEAQAQNRFAEQVILLAGLLLILALIGSAVFSALAVGRPIRRIADVLLALAQGNKAVEIPYAARSDEVGDAARAATTFKDNLLRLETMDSERKEVEARAAAQRKAEMHRLAEAFETAVGDIVNNVSSASSQLEAAAATLTRTADSTQALSGTVAAASEEASSNVEFGCVRHRRDGGLGRRDQPPGAGVEQHRARGGDAGGEDRLAHRRAVEGSATHRRRRQADHRDRRADQSAGAQRHHRGGARRRGRPRLRGGRPGGEGAGGANRQGDRRDRHADRRHADGDA